MIAFIVLILINLLILQKTREPDEFKEVKEKYRILREHLEDTNNEKFLCSCVMSQSQDIHV